MSVEIDGVTYRSLPEQVSKNMEDNERQDNKLTELERKLDAAISGVLHYKGSVATYADLPADAEVGDVYNVIDTGANYAWTGSGWDEFGSTVDLSGYAQKAVNEIITGNYNFQSGFSIGSQNCEIIPDTNGFTVESSSDPAKWLSITTDGIVGNDSQDLGSSTYTWNALYVEQIIPSANLTIGKAYNSVIIDSFFIPKKDNEYTIGNPSYVWSTIYVNAIEQKAGALSLGKSGNDINANGTIKPGTDNTRDLGSTSYKWKDLYLSGDTYHETFGNGEKYSFGGSYFWKTSVTTGNRFAIYRYNGTTLQGGVNFSSDTMRPHQSGIYNIGDASNLFNDLFLSGVISDGTNSVNIADLKALIDYAKSQGWIS